MAMINWFAFKIYSSHVLLVLCLSLLLLKSLPVCRASQGLLSRIFEVLHTKNSSPNPFSCLGLTDLGYENPIWLIRYTLHK
ncbi:hypothetical protein VNO77_16523 [Canavalia gladiata]|uniref:Secreted protein n=1 Tax=Canavalia gladiata TaxID=3824 RepID=A0AAN9M600_CANGL